MQRIEIDALAGQIEEAFTEEHAGKAIWAGNNAARMDLHWLSPAQCFGYLAFVLGVSSFTQTSDRRFKLLMTGECLAYVVHFALLGNPTAVASSLLSTLRSVLALRTRSPWVAFAVVAANLALGAALARQPADWLPLGASCLGTLALFLLQGVAMRLVMLAGTSLWIANNLIAGSIGGTALEVVVAGVNLWTIARMVQRNHGVQP
jgi:hypothetical protein